MHTCPMGLRSVIEYVACVFLSPDSKVEEISAGQRVLIMRSWLCRAAMTTEGEVEFMGVEMWEVGILEFVRVLWVKKDLFGGCVAV